MIRRKRQTVILFGVHVSLFYLGTYLEVVIGGLCHAGSSSTLWWPRKAIEQRLCLHFWVKPFSGVSSILSSIPRRFFLVPSVKVRRTSSRWENGSDISGKKGPRTCRQRQLFLLGDSFPFICYSSLTGTLIEETSLSLSLLLCSSNWQIEIQHTRTKKTRLKICNFFPNYWSKTILI